MLKKPIISKNLVRGSIVLEQRGEVTGEVKNIYK